MVRLQRKNSLLMPELHGSGHPKQQEHTEQDPQKDQTSHPPNPDAYFTRLPAPAKTVSSPRDTPFAGRATTSDDLLLYKGVAGVTPTASHSHPPTHWHTETCHLSWRGPSKFLMPVLEGAAKAALYSAHRASTGIVPAAPLPFSVFCRPALFMTIRRKITQSPNITGIELSKIPFLQDAQKDCPARPQRVKAQRRTLWGARCDE